MQPQAALHLHEAGREDWLLARIRQIADVVGMREYTFEVEIAELGSERVAICQCAPGRAYAKVTVDEAFFPLDAVEQTEVLVHEVIHPLLHPLMEHVNDLREELGMRQWMTVERVFRRDLERITDRLTNALVGLMGER